jgi:hypothetical protein
MEASLFKTIALRAIALVFTLSLAPMLCAQDTASIAGTVTDSLGAVIPGVHVVLTNPTTSAKYEGISNATGYFTINEVKAGPGYTATFSHEGFNSVAVTSLYLNVSTVRTQNAILTVGNVITTVSVSAGDQNVTLNTTDATIGNNFEVKMVNDLPVQLRDTPASLFILEPGVTEDASGQYSVTGARTDQSHVTLDGLDVDDRATGEFGVVIGNAPVDSVQEFRGVIAGETANFDSGGGGQFQLVTKSGTNQFHGSLFEYHRDTDLEANDWFNNNAGVPRPPLIRNQFGGNVGGPIRKNRAFFFFEYNGRRDDQGIAVDQTVPTQSYLAGNISYINNGNGCTPLSTSLSAPQCISTASATSVKQNYDPSGIGQDPGLATFLGQRYPTGNDPTSGDGINTEGFRFNAPVVFKENDYVARIDYNLSDTRKLFVRSSALSQRQADNINFVTPLQFPGDPVTRAIDNASWAWVVGHTWTIGDSKVNQASYGETIGRIDFPSLYNPTGALQWSFGAGYITAPYLGNYNAQGRVVPVPQLRDDFRWVKGEHTLQIGGAFRFPSPYNDLVLNDYVPGIGLTGVGLDELEPSLRPADILQSSSSLPTYNWDSALVFDLGSFTQIAGTFNYTAAGNVQAMGTGTSRKYRYYETEVYFGDSWKIGPSLTITYGVRYQLYSVPYEVNGIEAVQVNAATGKPLGFDEYLFKDRVPQSAAGISGPTVTPFLEYVLGGKANHSPGYYSPSYKDFAPRIAFAWSPAFDHTTVLNGSAGIVYDHTIVSAVQNFQDHSSYLFQSSNENIYGASTDPVGSLTSDPRFTGINSIPSPPAAPPFSSKQIPYVDTTTSPPFPYGLGFNTFSTAIDPNLRTPYSIMINAGIQHSFGSGLLLNVSYAGRFGRRLLAQVDGSQVLDFLDTGSGEYFSTAFTNIERQIRAGKNPNNIPIEPWFENQVGPIFSAYLPYFSNLFYNGDFGDFSQALAAYGLINSNVLMASQFSSNDYYTNKGFSAYHGLLATLHKNGGHGLQFDLNYTWSHSIDNFSLVANGQSNYVGEFICDATRPRECRSNSDFDLTQVFNGNFIYELPFGHGRSFASTIPAWADEIIGGWQVSGLPTWQTGSPYYANTTAYGASYANLAPAILVGSSAVVSSNPHKDPSTGYVFAYKDPAAADAAFTGPVGLNLGQRNELRSPHYVDLDLGVGKTFPIASEKARLVFRVDSFNSLNHPSFSSPDPVLISSNFGHITSTTSTARVLQGALRLEF